MSVDENPPRPPSVLFVCTGNTCRSVMAEALARRRFGSSVRVESAGIRPQWPEDAQDAIDTLRHFFKLDASGHAPRDVAGIDLDVFDVVVSLDPEVSKVLKPRRPHGLLKCHIDDPWGQPELYSRCARKILKNLNELELMLRRRGG